MKAKDLIEKLQELDPEEEIYLHDISYGADPVTEVSQIFINSSRGHHWPKDERWYIT